MSSEFYRLRGHKPVRCKDVLEWARWFEKADRHVAQTTIGSVLVSTVFMGLDHRFSQNKGSPLLFETMTFGDKDHCQTEEWYCTWDEAECGHKIVCELVRTNEEIERISLATSYRLTAFALRNRGIELSSVTGIPGMSPSEVQQYLDKMALSIADELESKARELAP